MDLGDVTGETIRRAQLAPEDFEEFVGQLLRSEAGRRHRDAMVYGPARRGARDGGCDIQIEVSQPPRVARGDTVAALIWDEPVVTWYSCKASSNWKKLVGRDLGGPGAKKHQAQGTTPTARTKRPPRPLLSCVTNGGRYVIVVDQPLGAQHEFLDEMTEVLRFWIEQEQLSVPADLRSRLAILDANALAAFIREHRPTISPSFRRALGAIDPPGLKTWEEWTREFFRGRPPPEFESDDERSRIITAISTSEGRVLRVFGAPGTGKTRVVHEALRRMGPEVEPRVRYCHDADRGEGIVHSPWVRDAGDVILVLDEFRSIDVESVVPRFQALASRGARLLLVGTSDRGTAERPDAMGFHLGALDDDATRRLVERELGPGDPDAVGVVCRLSEGYPLFAMLLAKALAEDYHSIARGDDETNQWDAACRVLAGSHAAYGNDEGKWRRTAEIRAKCLLVVLLTHGQEFSWAALWGEYGERLAHALDERTTWEEIKRAEHDCRARELLRYAGAETRRYVSPNNLARIILNHFLGGPDLGPGLRRHIPELHAGLHGLARDLHVRSNLLDGLARAEWDEVERRFHQDTAVGLQAHVSLVSKGLALAAKRCPERAAAAVARIVDGLADDDFSRAMDLRHAFREIAGRLIHRKISGPAFSGLEAGLFRMARFEDEPWSNNATGIWSSLFLVALSQTHQPWALRLGLLDRRLAATDEGERRLAIAALDRIIEPREMGLGHIDEDTVDGPWPQPSDGEFWPRKRELWQRLLDTCEDERPHVATMARMTVSGHLRAAVCFIPDFEQEVLPRLVDACGAWSAAERRALVETIADIRRYDHEIINDKPSLAAELDSLEAMLSPGSFHERLLNQFGTWFPGPWRIEDPHRPSQEEQGDRALVEEFLADPRSLDDELEWLVSSEAVRGRAFFLVAGRLDEQRSLLPAIERVTSPDARIGALAAYLQGWANAKDEGVDEYIEMWLDSETFLAEIGAALPFLPVSVRHLGWILALAQRDRIDPRAVSVIGTARWMDELPAATIADFLDELVAVGGKFSDAVLDIGTQLYERAIDDAERSRITLIFGRAIENSYDCRVATISRPAWTKAMRILAQAGKTRVVADALIVALDSSEHGANIGLGHETLQALLREGHGTELWRVMGPRLLDHRGGRMLATRLGREGLLASVDPTEILEWVGQDEQRAVVIADMAMPHGPELDSITRQLLARFGTGGRVARELRARAWSTPGVIIGSMVDFYRQQRDHAEAWAKNEEPAVREWATTLVDEFTRAIDEANARSEFRRKYA